MLTVAVVWEESFRNNFLRCTVLIKIIKYQYSKLYRRQATSLGCYLYISCLDYAYNLGSQTNKTTKNIKTTKQNEFYFHGR